MKYNTWLPIFPGFYGTIYGEENVDEWGLFDNPGNVKDEIQQFIFDTLWWDCYDYEQRQYDIVEWFISYLNYELSDQGFKARFKFQKIVSPREYNFKNDSVDVELSISRKEWQRIIKDLKGKYFNAFSEYIKSTYTSRSGFISHYSNDVHEWLEAIEKKDIDHAEHRVGSVLDFYLRMNSDNDIEDNMSMEYVEQEHDYDYIDYDGIVQSVNDWFKMSINSLSELEK